MSNNNNNTSKESRSFQDIKSYWTVKNDKPPKPTQTKTLPQQKSVSISENIPKPEQVKNSPTLAVVSENVPKTEQESISSTIIVGENENEIVPIIEQYTNSSTVYSAFVDESESNANVIVTNYDDGMILSNEGYEQHLSYSATGYTNNSISSYASGYSATSDRSYNSYNPNQANDIYSGSNTSLYSTNSENGLDYVYDPNIDILKVGSLEDLSNFDASKENTLNWNESFQKLLDLPESEDKYKKLSNMANDFVYCADTFGKIIISELHLPFDSKTIKPLDIGGIAGGLKYMCQDIIFKFVVDVELMEGLWMYGNFKRSDEYAQKSANHEIKGLNHFMDISNGLIRFPLMAIIDYRGYRLLAISRLPISKNSIVYGSNNSGKVVHNSNPLIFKEMERIAKILNLKGHEVGLNKTFLYGPGDIEIHQGTDNRFYMIDFARCFPPEYPLTFNNPKHKYNDGKIGREIFYSMLRPELVRVHHEPLSSDGFSGWQTSDNADEDYNKPLILATEKLHKEIIPNCINIIENRIESTNQEGEQSIESSNEWIEANNTPTDVDVGAEEYFLNLNPTNYISNSPVKDYSAKIHEIKKLINYIHTKGINLRYLGLICRNIKNHMIKQIFLTEVAARVWKRIIRSRLRQIMDLTKRPSEEPYKRMIAEIFSLILNVNTSVQRDFWSVSSPGNFKYIALAIFPRCLSESDISSNIDLRAIIDCRLLAIRIIEMLNIRINSAAYTQFLSDPQYILTTKDIEEVGSTIKYPTIIDFASGSVLLYETQNVIRTTLAVPKEINRWIDSAQTKLSKALSSMPMSFQLTVKLATTYLFRSNVTSDFQEAIKQLNHAVVMINLAPSNQRNHSLLLALLGMCHLKLGTIYLYYTKNYKQYQQELDLAKDRLSEAFEKDPKAIDDFVVQSFPLTTEANTRYICPATKFNHSRKVNELFAVFYILHGLDENHILRKSLPQYFEQIVTIDNIEIPPSLTRIMDYTIVDDILKNIYNLRSIKFTKTHISALGFEHISKMKNLKSLYLSTQIFFSSSQKESPSSIDSFNTFFKNLLTNCKGIDDLKLASRGIDDAAFKDIYELFSNIKSLMLCDTYITDQTLLAMAPYLQSLNSLQLYSGSFKDPGVCAILNSNKNLTTLDVSYLNYLTDITANTIISTQTKLTSLAISRVKFSAEAISEIVKGVPDIQFLDLSNTNADQLTIESLASHGAVNLNHLSMSHNHNVEDHALEILGNLNLKLAVLELPQSTFDNGFIWKLLKTLPYLQRFKTPDFFHIPNFMNKFEDHNMREDYEQPLYNLRQLDLTMSTISISSLQKLVDLMPLVDNLSLSAVTFVDDNCYVIKPDENTLSSLYPLFYNIKFLDLSNLPIHKRSIPGLIKSCPSLVTLTLLNCKEITEQDKYDSSVKYPHIQFF